MPLSEVMNPFRYDDEEWLRFHRELEEYAPGKHLFRHTSGEINRKGWEWTQAAYGLSRLGVVHGEAEGLGVGAGHEAILFWLTDRCRKIVATDLYGNADWSSDCGLEADGAFLVNPRRFSRRDFAVERLRVMSADGTALPFGDNSFDFCWSISSIEHFGGHKAAAQAVREMGRVVRPGGVVCIATEYLLLPEQSHAEFFTRREIEEDVIGAAATSCSTTGTYSGRHLLSF